MENLGWGLEMMAIGMGLVFSMLILLMLSLMIIGATDNVGSKTAAEAPAAIAPAAPVAAPVAVAAVSASSDEKIATIAVAVHTALRGQGPALVANQSGTGLGTSRWVAIGRSMQIKSWHRS